MENNFVLPKIILESWKENDDFLIKNIELNQKIKYHILDKNHILYRMFDNHNAFDVNKMFNQFIHISILAKKIIDLNVRLKTNIILNGQETLYIKYYYFLISFINNTYEFKFGNKAYFAKDVEFLSNKSKDKLYILLSINYIIFDLFDILFSEKIFLGLDEYVERNRDFFDKTQFTNIIKFPENLELSQNFSFIDFHFHNIVNNTFIKFIAINPIEQKKTFLATSLSMANFYDSRFNINTISFFVLFPEVCVALINIGPGRGELRPIFNLIKKNRINNRILKNIMNSDHTIYLNDIYLTNNQQIRYKPFIANLEQIKFINNSLINWMR